MTPLHRHQRQARAADGSLLCLVALVSNAVFLIYTSGLYTGSYMDAMNHFYDYDWSWNASGEQRHEQRLIVVSNEEQTQKKSSHYTVDLCSGCRMAQITGGLSCGQRIERHLRNSNMTDLQAAQKVSQEFPEKCARCHPDACSEREKRYLRFDAAAPRTLDARTLYLSSVPSKHRLPANALANLSAYFEDEENVYPARSYFFEYNPSIVRLPESEVPSNLLDATYLASFRVTNMQQCVYGENELKMIGGSWPRPPQHDYLGLAVLDRNLSILQETVVNIGQMQIRKYEDFRVFSLHDQLYVSTTAYLFPIWLHKNDTMKDIKLLKPEFESSTLPIFIRSYPTCVSNPGARSVGKNFNLFTDADKTLVEIYPMTRKKTVNLTKKCSENSTFQQYETPMPPPSFLTIDEPHFISHGVYKPPMTVERGSACCVALTYNDTQLLLGISHSKTRFQSKENRNNVGGGVAANTFFSTFYVFEPTPPYAVVARSGKFCLGFSEEGETDGNPYARSNLGALEMGTKFDCPKIHFVSGMVERAEDPSQVIIAYGVNDCTPRFITVSKKDIIEMLFRPNKIIDVERRP